MGKVILCRRRVPGVCYSCVPGTWLIVKVRMRLKISAERAQTGQELIFGDYKNHQHFYHFNH
jgi:hypothetical protein